MRNIICFICLFVSLFSYSQTNEEYWPNGKLKTKSNNKGYYLRYYENGQLERKDTIIDQNWDFRISYYPNGQLKSSAYIDKKMKGLQRNSTSYFENGKISNKTICDSLYKVIYEVKFYENGKKETEYFRRGDSLKNLAFFKNGQLHQSDIWFNHRRTGDYLEYYENGQLKQKIIFKEGYPIGEHIVYYNNGIISDYQTYFFSKGRNYDKIPPDFAGERPPRDGKYYQYYKSGAIEMEGRYNKGMKVGFWAEYDEYQNKLPVNKNQKGPLLWCEKYDENGKADSIWIDNKRYHTKTTYAHGHKVEEITFDENGKIKNKITYDLPPETSNQNNSNIQNESPQSTTNKEEAYTVVDMMPEFPGGSMEMMKFIRDNIKYPQSAYDSGISGKCFLKFIVGSDGAIRNIQVLKGVAGCPDCDKEAVRVVESMPKWKPGTSGGKPVSVYFNQPINFTTK